MNDTQDTSHDDLTQAHAAWAAAEARAEAAEQARSRYLARINQDLQEALAGLIDTARLMEATRLTGEQRCMLDRMHGAGEAMSLILSAAYDQAEIAASQIVLRTEPFPLGEALRGATAKAVMAAARKGIDFSLRVDPSAERIVRGDAARLGQIVASLVHNAVKFTDRGSIAVSVDVEENGDCRIVVSDTGVGIPPAAQADLFSGLLRVDGDAVPCAGLAQARLLADLMGARLECESMHGVGSAFVLTLPVAHLARPAEQDAPAAEPETIAA